MEVTLREYRDGDGAALVSLWREAGLLRPWNDPQQDIALALATPSAVILVGERDGALVASVMAGSDGHRGWMYYLAVAVRVRREGVGRRLVAAAEAFLARQGVRKVQLIVREENAAVCAFYERVGYVHEPRVMMSRRLDDGSS